MYICVCIYTCVYTGVCHHGVLVGVYSVCKNTYVYMYVPICVCVYIYGRARVCVCVRLQAHLHRLCMNACMHACLLINANIYICIYIERERVHQTCERYSLYVYVQLCSLLRICWQAGGSQQSTETLVCLSIYPCVCPPDCMIALCSKQVPTTQPATKN